MKASVNFLLFAGLLLSSIARADVDAGSIQPTLTTDQKIAAAHGQTVIGNILVCQIKDRASGKIIAEGAINPSFGLIPNNQLKLNSADASALVTIISTDTVDGAKDKALMRVDLMSNHQQQTSGFFSSKILTISQNQFGPAPKLVASTSLTIDRAADGQSKSVALVCRGSYPGLGFSSDD